MLVDEYEQYNNDRTDVIVVSRSGSEEEPEPELLANDCTDFFPPPFELDQCKTPLFLFCDFCVRTTLRPPRGSRSRRFLPWSSS